jgi:hypothetical protein
MSSAAMTSGFQAMISPPREPSMGEYVKALRYGGRKDLHFDAFGACNFDSWRQTMWG